MPCAGLQNQTLQRIPTLLRGSYCDRRRERFWQPARTNYEAKVLPPVSGPTLAIVRLEAISRRSIIRSAFVADLGHSGHTYSCDVFRLR